MSNEIPEIEGILADYVSKLGEIAKAQEPLISVAVKLKDTQEWKAMKELLQFKIAAETVRFAHAIGEVDDEPRGFIRGMEYVISFAEDIVGKAMDKKKLVAEKMLKNELTRSQEQV